MKFLRELPYRFRRITTSGSYKAEVDGLRFWAILPVVLWHGIQRISRAQPDLSDHERSMMLWIPEARVGVTLFLAISGFIIASQFIKAMGSSRRMDLRAYFYRRVTRIEPPYLLLLLVTYLGLTLTSYRPENAVAFWRGDQSLTASLFASALYVHGLVYNEMPKLFPGGWSLEVEVQFYILAPAVFALFYLAPTVGKRLVVGAVVLVATFAASRYFENLLGPMGPHRYTLIRYFFYFWLGTLIAEMNHFGLWPKLPRVAWDVGAFVSLVAYYGSGVAEHTDWWPISDGTLDALRLLAFLLMFAGAINGFVFRSLCRLPWISLLGGACYSIYLTHVQVMQVAAPRIAAVFQPSSLLVAAALAAALLLPAVVAVGLTFYALVERPFMVPHWPEKLASWVRLRWRGPAVRATTTRASTS
jgi:peptidoglycan/LPS O-acetylase OafA/YrhL